MKQLIPSLSVALGVLLTFLVQNSQFNTLSSYLLAVFIVFSAIYIMLNQRSASRQKLLSGNPLELFALSVIVMLILSLTGSLNSPLFFFLFLFIFTLPFITRKTAVIAFSTCALLFFLPEIIRETTQDSLIKIGSIILLSPIAYFVGYELERRQKLGEKIKEKTETIVEDAQALKEDGDLRHPEETEALDEIIEEADSLNKDSKE